MILLPTMQCPRCGGPLAAAEDVAVIATAAAFEDCLRRCEPCGIAVSNAADPRSLTFIHRDPLDNIPNESRAGAFEALSQALNIRNRISKRRRFGFSTSEDAVTWVVFTYLLSTGRLADALCRAAQLPNTASATSPALLLWGSPIGGDTRAAELRTELERACAGLEEEPNSFSEPDVVVDLGEAGLIFVEVKYRSGNDRKPPDYRGWDRYARAPGLAWQIDEVRASGCYELARNWCLLKRLAGTKRAALVNLGFDTLFRGDDGRRLDRFVAALGDEPHSHFSKVEWPRLLAGEMSGAPRWFTEFCGQRNLFGPSGGARLMLA